MQIIQFPLSDTIHGTMTRLDSAPPLDRRRFVVRAPPLAAAAMVGGCVARNGGKRGDSATRIGVKGRRIASVPCPEE